MVVFGIHLPYASFAISIFNAHAAGIHNCTVLKRDVLFDMLYPVCVNACDS